MAGIVPQQCLSLPQLSDVPTTEGCSEPLNGILVEAERSQTQMPAFSS